ncbi:MAG: hypothetical protein ACKKL4_01925 [Patescibacteria group bacterium]
MGIDNMQSGSCGTSVIYLPTWWRMRDGLSPGAIWHHYQIEKSRAAQIWLERRMDAHAQNMECIEDLISLANSLKYFSPPLYEKMRTRIQGRIHKLYYQGKRVTYPTRTLEILLPLLVEMGVLECII